MIDVTFLHKNAMVLVFHQYIFYAIRLSKIFFFNTMLSRCFQKIVFLKKLQTKYGLSNKKWSCKKTLNITPTLYKLQNTEFYCLMNIERMLHLEFGWWKVTYIKPDKKTYEITMLVMKNMLNILISCTLLPSPHSTLT